MNSLRDYYIQLNKVSLFRDEYCSTSGNKSGKIFFFLNTNYRGILIKSGSRLTGFANGFEVLSAIEGIERSEWIKSSQTSQEKEKQHVVNMRKAELFRVVDSTYHKTSRGIVFEKAMSNKVLKFEDKKFLTYLFILTGYFNNIPNYIFERTKEIYEYWENSGISAQEALETQRDFIRKANGDTKMLELLLHDYVYMDSFAIPFGEINFLNEYWNSSEVQKLKLKEYIYENYDNKSYRCLISYKFKPGGMYVKNTILENAWILALTKTLIDNAPKNFDQFINIALEEFGKYFAINKTNLKKFIYDTDKNRSVFQVIFCKAFNIPMPLLSMEKDLTVEEIQELGQIDPTDENGQQKLNDVNQSLTKLAKLKSNYKCDLEDTEMCKYFTAKSTNKNYLEIHHYIPREFANDFDDTIEVLENYVALCPNCHRKIHLAVDTERKHMINILYNKRQQALAKRNLNIDLKTIYSYYDIK